MIKIIFVLLIAKYYFYDNLKVSGCNSARLESASGGREVGRSNRLTPTQIIISGNINYSTIIT